MTAHALLIDLDAEPGSIGDFHMPTLDEDGARGHILGEPLVGKSEPPGELRQHGSDMHGRRAGDARLTGLGRNIDLEPELLAKVARRHDAAHAAKLYGFQAHSAGGTP